MTALPFAPRRRGTALLTVLLGLAAGPALAQAAGDPKGSRTGGTGRTGTGTGGPDGVGMPRSGSGTGQ